METFILINSLLVVAGLTLIFLEVFLGIDSMFDLILSGASILLGGLVGLLFSSEVVGLVVSFGLLITYFALGRSYVQSKLYVPLLKSNSDSLVGSEAKIIKTMDDGIGQVKIHGEVWGVESKDQLTVNDMVVVDRVEGVKLIVSRKK